MGLCWTSRRSRKVRDVQPSIFAFTSSTVSQPGAFISGLICLPTGAAVNLGRAPHVKGRISQRILLKLATIQPANHSTTNAQLGFARKIIEASLNINQADTEQIGTSEVDLLAKEIGSSGQIAILSAAATATNQNSWIKYMKVELKKYPKMQLVSTVYGNDDPATSLTVLQGLLGLPQPARHHLADHGRYLDGCSVPRHAQVTAQAPDPHRSRPALADEEVRARRHREVL